MLDTTMTSRFFGHKTWQVQTISGNKLPVKLMELKLVGQIKLKAFKGIILIFWINF